jgi:hypothetical protein
MAIEDAPLFRRKNTIVALIRERGGDWSQLFPFSFWRYIVISIITIYRQNVKPELKTVHQALYLSRGRNP